MIMGLQLSVIIGCMGALEFLAYMTHVIVCVLKLFDQTSNCCIKYFHPSETYNGFLIVDKSNLEVDAKATCESKIETVVQETESKPDTRCINPPLVDGYVRIPTPIPFGVADSITDQKSSSNPSSLMDSGNEHHLTVRKFNDNASLMVKRYNDSSSDLSSLDDIDNTTNWTAKKRVRRSRTPELPRDSCDDYDDGEEDDVDRQKKYHKVSKVSSNLANRKSMRFKSKSMEFGKSAENLSIIRKSKRYREPERCKSDIQIQVTRTRNLLHDEWTNTTPTGSNDNLSEASSKRSISVLIQTSFDDEPIFPENNGSQNFKAEHKLQSGVSCDCCNGCKRSKVTRVADTGSVNEKQPLLKISSFEEASEDDYEKLRDAIRDKQTSSKNDIPKERDKRIEPSIDNESYDEYVDAEDEDSSSSKQPIRYIVPDSEDNKSFWVI